MNKKTKYRILEIIPGALVWLTFIGSIILSFIKPLWVIIFIIAFSFYWFLRVIYFIFYLFVSWKRFRHDVKINWWQRILKINGWKKIYHLIILPMYKEELEVVITTFETLLKTSYPKEKFIIILSGEERKKEHFERIAKIIEERYKDKFFKLIITLHPKDLPREIPAKGANANWAGHRAKELIDQLNIPYENIIVSYFDINTCVHPQYFAYLTYKYLTHPSPTRTSFQPVALYNNNIWASYSLTRIAAFGTTFWLLTELARPDRLFTFSSHSMSFKALVDVGFWQKDIVTDDSRIFLQCFIHYDGDYTVTPMYIPVSMDTVEGENFWQATLNLYKQQRRWAWGVEHFPYMVWHFFQKKNKIPFGKKIKYLWNLGEGMYSWATVPVLIFLLGRLPLWVAPFEIKNLVIYQNTPFVLKTILSAAMIGILFSAILSLLLLPSPLQKRNYFRLIFIFLQWILLPITLVIFGSIPATDAQTRLMFGRYLGFFNTPKSRKERLAYLTQ